MKYKEYKEALKDFDYAIIHYDDALTAVHDAHFYCNEVRSNGSDIPTMATAMMKAQIAYMDVILEEVKKAREYYEEHIRELVEDYPEDE